MENSKDLKPIICILNPDDKWYIDKYGEGNVSRLCVTGNEIDNLRSQGVKFPDQSQLKENLVLTKDYSSNEYLIRTPDYDRNKVEGRIKATLDILSYLGAKFCKIEYYTSEESKRNHSFDGELHIKTKGSFGDKEEGVKASDSKNADLTVLNKNQSSDKYTKSILDEAKWPGSYDEIGFEKAKEIAQREGLDTDEGIKSLLNQRNPYHHNAIQKERYRVDLIKEMREANRLEVSLHAGIKSKLGVSLISASTSVDIDGKIKVINNSSAKLHEIMDIQVEFGEYKHKQAKSVNDFDSVGISQPSLSQSSTISPNSTKK